MHIALTHLRQAAIGGTEQVLNALTRHLIVAGHDVTIVCRTHETAPDPRARFVTLHPRTWSKAGRLWAFARDVESHLTRAHYDVVLGLGRTWTQDVVRTGGGTYASFLEHARRFSDTRLERRLGLKRAQHKAALEIERRAFAPGAYRRVIANSRMVARDVERRYAVSPRDIALIYNGVDLERFRPPASSERRRLRTEWGLGDGEFALGFVGSGFGRKGLDRLLEALPSVVARENAAHLFVLGHNSNQRAYAARARRLGVAERVRFLGARNDPERFFAACDVFVLPSWYDSFAFSILEAMACGVPVITTEWAGASELVVDGRHGQVLGGDVGAPALADAIVAWLVRERIEEARVGLRRQAEKFGFERTLAEIERVLVEAALARRAAGGPAREERALS